MTQLAHRQDCLKMIRETLCAASAALGASPQGADRRSEHMDRCQRMIDEIDRLRPLGVDGKHGSRHTPTCGCEG